MCSLLLKELFKLFFVLNWEVERNKVLEKFLGISKINITNVRDALNCNCRSRVYFLIDRDSRWFSGLFSFVMSFVKPISICVELRVCFSLGNGRHLIMFSGR